MGFGYFLNSPTSLHLKAGQEPSRDPQQESSTPPLPAAKVERLAEKLGPAIDQAVARFREVLTAVLADQPYLCDPKDLMELETHLHRDVARECLDPLVGAAIQLSHDDPDVQIRASVLQESRSSFRLQKSDQPVRITLLGGSKIEIQTPYYLYRPPTRRGRPRKKNGRRKANNNGLYPYLKVLGLHLRASPALVSEVGRLIALGTIDLTRDTLERRGILLGRKVISRIASSLAQSGLAYRDWMEEQTRNGARGHVAKGMRLAIGCDGGRVRIRFPRKRGRKRKSGRRGFDGEWKEPKILVVYQIDEKGRKLRGGLCRYDATMLRVDGFFELLTSLLREIGAQEAAEWIVVGDGADWIWNRVPDLVEALGFDEAKVKQVVDFYHAVERLHKIVGEFCGWSKSERNDWVTRMKRLLHRDRAEEVFEQRALFKGRGSKKRRQLFDYFDDHAERMRYGTFRKQGYPLGSGAVESCVRRVVNLRLKSNGIFWSLESAEEVLHLRAQLLCGRWDNLVQTILRPSEVWTFDGSDGYQACNNKALSHDHGETEEKPVDVQQIEDQAA